MKSKKLLFCAISVVLIIVSIRTGQVYAYLFSENFEGDLSVWTGKTGEDHHGVIVVDPKDTGNKALSFTALNGAGDIFSPEITDLGGDYFLRFDYLGDPIPTGGDPGWEDISLGGFIGYSINNDPPYNPGHQWLAGTENTGAQWEDASFINTLIDDGNWHTYEISFTGPEVMHLMLEDVLQDGGVAGDVYFDNITLIPLPSTLLLFGSGLFGFAMIRRKLRKS